MCVCVSCKGWQVASALCRGCVGLIWSQRLSGCLPSRSEGRYTAALQCKHSACHREELISTYHTHTRSQDLSHTNTQAGKAR